MKNKLKGLGQSVNESDHDGMEMSSTDSRSPEIGDEVFVSGFADDGGVVINSYAGYGRIIEARDGRYSVELEDIFDSTGSSDNGPEEISFGDRDIVSGERGIWAVFKLGMQFE